MRRTSNGTDGWRIDYDSITELASNVTGPSGWTPFDGNNGRHDASDQDIPPSTSWDLELGLHGALNLARDGWKLDGKHTPVGMLSNPHGKIEFHETGDEVDVGLFLSGEPECFVQRVGEIPFRTEHLVIDVAYSCRTDAVKIAANGLALWQSLLQSHSRGIEIEITAIASRIGDGRKDVTTIKIRSSGDPLESHQFMASIHPAFMRRLIFRSMFMHMKTPMYAAGYDYNELDQVREVLGSGYKGCRYARIKDFNPSIPLEDLPVI